MDYTARIAGARERMKREGIDLLLLSPSTDLIYLTGVRERMMERLVLFALGAEEAHFIAPGFELGNLPDTARDLMTCHGWTDGEDPYRLADAILPKGAVRVAVGGKMPAWELLGIQALRPAYECVPADGLLRELRMVKDEGEYELIKRAQVNSCKAFEQLMEHGIGGMTEMEAAKLLMTYSEQLGVVDEGVPIVASGPNSALPHHHTGERVIQEGDVVVIDFGGSNAGVGYIADTTRTVCVGRIPDGFQEIYDIVRRANQVGFEAAKPGATGAEVDRAARRVIEEAGYGEYFTHRLGHGLGLDVHEHPYLSADNDRPLEAGNVCSDEPGIYIPGRFGVRIEDIIIVRDEGAERLTPLHHDLRVVD